MKKLIFSLLICMVVFQYCTSSKKATVTAPPPVTYLTDIQPTITANCSPCHIPPKGFKKALDTYAAAKGDIDDIISRIKLNPGDRGFMPFKHAKLSDSVINIFVQWKAGGLAEK